MEVFYGTIRKHSFSDCLLLKLFFVICIFTSVYTINYILIIFPAWCLKFMFIFLKVFKTFSTHIIRFVSISVARGICKSECLVFDPLSAAWGLTLFKKRLWCRPFPVNFAKFLRTPFLTEHLRRLFMYLNFLLTFFRWNLISTNGKFYQHFIMLYLINLSSFPKRFTL